MMRAVLNRQRSLQEQIDSTAIRKVIKAGTDVKTISTDAVSVLQDALVRTNS